MAESSRGARLPRGAGPMPDRAALHDAALHHLARYAATEAGLLRVLRRRIERWLRATGADPADAAPALAAAQEVARTLAASGAVDDAAFAETRARRLLRAGRSGRAVAAHLQAKGVGSSLLDQLRPGPDEELLAALAFARRRRLGPFRTQPGDADAGHRELGALARAGFPRDIADRVLRMPPDQAETLLAELRRS